MDILILKKNPTRFQLSIFYIFPALNSGGGIRENKIVYMLI